MSIPADVQAAYAGWALPGAAADPAPLPSRQPERRAAPPLPPPSPALLSVLQGEVQQLWHSVVGGELPGSHLQTYEGAAGAPACAASAAG